MEWRQYARYSFFQAKGHIQRIPSLSMNMCKDKKSVSDGPPACSILQQFSLFCLEKKSVFLKGSQVLHDICSEATKKASFGLADVKLCSSLLFCGINSPACQHFSWALKPNILSFSAVSCLRLVSKTTISYPFSKLTKQNQLYGT